MLTGPEVVWPENTDLGHLADFLNGSESFGDGSESFSQLNVLSAS